MNDQVLGSGLCYDGTCRPVEVGDVVSWRFEDRSPTGVVEYIDEEKFVVRWRDIGVQEYDSSAVAALVYRRKTKL